ALRRKHAGRSSDPRTEKAYTLNRTLECYAIGAKEIGWSKRKTGGLRGSTPHRRRGLGLGTQIWGGGGGPPAYATVHFNADGKGSRFPDPDGLSIKTFGAHFAQVEVDVRTGEIFVEKIVAVHDIGRIVNPLTAESQVQGGVIQALGFALSEERVVDRALGRVMNANLEWYKVPTVMDVPEIVVRFVDKPDRKANNLGAKGL